MNPNFIRMLRMRLCRTSIVTLVVCVFSFSHVALAVDLVDSSNDEQQQISQKQAEIEELTKEIEQLKSKRDVTAAEGDKIEVQIAIVTQELQKAKLEIVKTQDTIEQVEGEKADTEHSIEEIKRRIEEGREHLRVLLRTLHQYEQQSWIRLFFDTWSLSEVLSQRAVYKELQDRVVRTVSKMRVEEEQLRQYEEELNQQLQDAQQLQMMLGAQQDELSLKKVQKDEFLQLTRQQQSTYEHQLREAEQARQEILEHVFRLRNAKIEVSLNSAFEMATYAGSLTGVRPALLLAVLKVESNVGERVGSGVFPDDMHPANRDAFQRITAKLGLDPHEAKIAARPRSLKGWGGAMGPAQIMPNTWERIESRLIKLMNKSPVNPYDLTDAFVATALLLADSGAADPSKEYQAVNRYIAGPNWQYYTWYGERVLAVAEEYEKEF